MVIALCLAFFASGANAQADLKLPIDQTGAIATQALMAGETELALQIADAVLQQRPDDRNALIVIAAAATRIGDPRRSRVAGARAWRVSTTDYQKYEAARLTALAAANEKRFTLATFWLRRALTVAPNEDERTRTLNDARSVTRINPWSTQLSFSLAPSSNVNGGAEDESLTAPGNPTGTLSEDALALAGWSASLSFGAQYRFQEAQRSRTTVGVAYQTARVWITEDTRVPDEAFNTNSYNLSLRHDRALDNGTLSFNASRGLFEYRDLDLRTQTTDYEKYDIWRLGVDRQFALNERTLLSFSASREWLSYLATGIGEVDRALLSGGVSYRLGGGDRVSTTLSLIDSNGDSLNFTSQQQTLSVGYNFAEPLGPITLSLGGGLKWSDYPEYRLLNAVTDGRQDTTIFASANIGFPNIEYAGFAPGLRLDVSNTDSNVSRFAGTTLSAGLTIRSQF
jgi:hypothetical protein